MHSRHSVMRLFRGDRFIVDTITAEKNRSALTEPGKYRHYGVPPSFRLLFQIARFCLSTKIGE